MDWKEYKFGVYLVNVLGIIYNLKTKKIIIGRREKDPYIKKLTWCFPGGRPKYNESLEKALKREIRIKTRLKVKIKKVIFARTYPEKKEFLSLYYYCETKQVRAISRELFREVKWIRPTEVKKYFTTSLHPKVFKFLKSLEKK